ncbi:unnamed protein product [Mytilus edulis]|uniref:Integrase p58-like C-terminal domain-containing protein n=1 Tax=Mytilus edulis TaxID=6550 RepID=A0A8S3TAE0_MYTED|nr:unnamed protein product [Mytilus edulis]
MVAANVLVILLAVVRCLHLSDGSSHWVVTENGRVQAQLDTVFNLRRPYDLVAFMKQEDRGGTILQLKRELLQRKEEIDKNEDRDTGLEQRFYKTDIDCVAAGKPLPEFDLYISTVLPLENKGIRPEEHIDLSITPRDNLHQPDCRLFSELEYNNSYIREKDETDKSKYRHTGNTDNSGVKIKPCHYNGSTSWTDYLSHFEMCALVNNWSENRKGLYLAVSLMGQAQAVLGDLPSEKRQNYSDLVSALEERFAPSSQTELYRVQFKERRQRASESLPELGQSIRRLSNLAYPTAPLDVRETLGKEQFIDALVDSEMRLRIKQSRPKGLNDAVRLAVELEAYNKAENKVREGRGYLRQTMNDDEFDREEKITKSDSPTKDIASWMQTMEKSLSTLTTEIAKLKSSGTNEGRYYAKTRYTQKTVAYPEEIRTIIMEIRGDGSVKTLMKTRKQNNRKTNEGAVTTASEDAGMYVKLNVGDIEAKFVVDTGATLTLVSSKLYDMLTPLDKSYLSEVKTSVRSVCGTKLELRGKGRFNLHFGPNMLQSEAVVTDLQVDGILGLDFMKRHNCLIDVKNGHFCIGDFRVDLCFQGSIGCYRVVASEAVVIPPRSEIVINGTVCLAEGQKLPADNALLEANEHAGKDYILTARTLVRSGEKVPVRLMNTELDPKTIYPGTTIAQMSGVEQVLDGNISSNEQKHDGLRPDLQDLLDRTSDELTSKDKQKVKSLLIENQNLFASSDVDLGRTNLVKHEINTGNARPFKEPPRRTPYHLNKVVNDNLDKMLQKEIIKDIPAHKLAWELKEKLEHSHSFVRGKIKGQMRRQKHYHDLKLSYQNFRKDDEVYVYFPVKKPGMSSKLTSFWKGPFKILDKYGDLTYKVDCGYRGKPQVIHVDRLKKKNKQTLRTESDNNTFVPLDTENDTAENDPIETPYVQDIAVHESTLPVEETEESSHEGRRTRRKPAWMADYIVK